MSDLVSKEKRSEIMSKIKSSKTKPEIKIKKTMNKIGFIYQPKGIYGNPDFGNKKLKIAVFVDGCFWHGCIRHCRMPKTNRKYWILKIKRNVERDKKVIRKLKMEGWKVVRIWEHDIFI